MRRFRVYLKNPRELLSFRGEKRGFPLFSKLLGLSMESTFSGVICSILILRGQIFEYLRKVIFNPFRTAVAFWDKPLIV